MLNKKGFSLVEVIMAIGILMLASGFIIQLFITARDMNNKAYDLDKSITVSTKLVEEFKASSSDAEWVKRLEMKGAMIDESLKTFHFEMAFDKNFEPISKDSKEVVFTLIGSIDPTDADSKKEKIQIKVNKRSPLSVENEIYALEASKYIK